MQARAGRWASGHKQALSLPRGDSQGVQPTSAPHSRHLGGSRMLLTSLGFETRSCGQVDNFLSDFQTYNLSALEELSLSTQGQ